MITDKTDVIIDNKQCCFYRHKPSKDQAEIQQFPFTAEQAEPVAAAGGD